MHIPIYLPIYRSIYLAIWISLSRFGLTLSLLLGRFGAGIRSRLII